MRHFRPGPRLVEYALLLVAMLLYLASLDNGLQPYELLGGDLITHHYAQVEARFANAPGYPLYSLGGWLWFHAIHMLASALGNAQPNPIPILSSYSTIWALLALWLLYRLILRATQSPPRPRGNWPVAWLLSAFFGTTYFFWYYATTSEQYSSAVAQTLAILYVYNLWATRSAAARSTTQTGYPTPVPGDNRWLYVLAFLCGLSLAHMLTVAFIVPPLLIVVLHQAPGLLRSMRALTGAVLAAALPLVSYSFVYIRGAQHPAWRGQGNWQSNAAWFWDFVGTGQGREELGWGLAPDAPFFGNGFPELIWAELSIPLLLAGLIGIAFLPRRTTFMLYTTLAIYLIFCWAYRLGNWYQVILPAYPFIMLGVAGLVARMEKWLDRVELPATGRNICQAGILVALALALFWRVDASLPQVNSRNRPEDTALARAAILLTPELPANAALFAAVDDTLALQYLGRIWGLRADIKLLGRDQARAALQAGDTVWVSWDSVQLLLDELWETTAVWDAGAPPESLAIFAHSPAWYGIRLNIDAPREPISAQTHSRPVRNTVQPQLTDRIRLPAYAVGDGPTGAPVTETEGTHIDVTLYWDIEPNQWDTDLRISVRLLGIDGYLVAHAEPGAQPDPAFAALDRSRPAPLLPQPPQTAPATRLIPLTTSIEGIPTYADPYQFVLADASLVDVIALEVILYRTHDGQFENIAVVQMPVAHAPLSPP
ncbi:MAG: DUF2723 domain-containing protein [Litorilinea sp.]